jgi:FkbM family methyltransferase
MLKRVFQKFAKWVFRPRIVVIADRAHETRLGTVYGGKTFMDRHYLHGGIVISAGLGEDASFDVEFASRYGAKVIIVDPTPRSIVYFNKLIARVGQPAERIYGTSGCLPIESYDLTRISRENILYIDKALWTEATTLRFFLPKDVEHVSHSIVNFQNDHRDDTPFIEVETTTISDLMGKFEIETIDIFKLDIEGAEIHVLHDMLDKYIHPRQILVEFDELSQPSGVVKKKYEELYKKLLSHGYVCKSWDGYADYCFELKS